MYEKLQHLLLFETYPAKLYENETKRDLYREYGFRDDGSLYDWAYQWLTLESRLPYPTGDPDEPYSKHSFCCPQEFSDAVKRKQEVHNSLAAEHHWECCYPKKPKADPGWYLMTFTLRPQLILGVKQKVHSQTYIDQWKTFLLKQFKRKCFREGKYVIEHESTNIHCHVHAYLLQDPFGDRFKAYEENYGSIDRKKVEKDNGIDGYFRKENQPVYFKNISDE